MRFLNVRQGSKLVGCNRSHRRVACQDARQIGSRRERRGAIDTALPVPRASDGLTDLHGAWLRKAGSSFTSSMQADPPTIARRGGSRPGPPSRNACTPVLPCRRLARTSATTDAGAAGEAEPGPRALPVPAGPAARNASQLDALLADLAALRQRQKEAGTGEAEEEGEAAVYDPAGRCRMVLLPAAGRRPGAWRRVHKASPAAALWISCGGNTGHLCPPPLRLSHSAATARGHVVRRGRRGVGVVADGR